ncbi:hypothetical protein ASPCAL04190 [Aspergillus calidoustus]|uniref:Transcription factor domain-containing protein n=1 Tax=Aspergillus calidoustus TaxID=454130 RepID=A0A0U5FWE1_ASPCI|nr:hypothetical protein ASPCAL04190 [Aspergillus calidoustus]
MKGAYQENPSLDMILSSFFLHIHSANRGQIFKATLLLREAITMAQLLGLDQAGHYAGRSATEAQDRLRIIWLLHITERGHATRFDLQCILHLDSRLPALHADENPFDLLPFLGMVQLFQTFGTAINSFELHDECHLLPAMDMEIQQIPQLLDHSPDSQLVDFLITKQWMRLILWRRAMFHVELSLNMAAESLSVFFPEQLAQKVVAHISTFPRGVVGSHGLGMQMKLADIAISLADVLSCRSGNSESHEYMRVGSRDLLHYLAAFLTSIPNSVSL